MELQTCFKFPEAISRARIDGEQGFKSVLAGGPVKFDVRRRSSCSKNVMVIGHPDLNDIVAKDLAGGGAPVFYPEIGPLVFAFPYRYRILHFGLIGYRL
jgi:hypothetical protein